MSSQDAPGSLLPPSAPPGERGEGEEPAVPGDPGGGWRHRMGEFTDDWNLFWEALLCPCVLQAKNKSALEGGRPDEVHKPTCVALGAACGLNAVVPGLGYAAHVLYATNRRHDITEKYNITEENLPVKFLHSAACMPCALTQETREIRSRAPPVSEAPAPQEMEVEGAPRPA